MGKELNNTPRQHKPPPLAERLIKHLSWVEDRDAIIDNLNEEYRDRLSRQGQWRACWWYRQHVLRSVIPLISFKSIRGASMLKNYLRIAIRKINRQKTYSLINILGLAIGMTMAMLILLWIKDELSYDRFHVNAERIYRVSQAHCREGNITKTANTPAVLAETLMLECPEVELATCIRGDGNGTLIEKDNIKIHEPGIGITDHKFFKVFSFPLIAGDSETALDSPGKVVLSQKAAKKYFRDSNPIGKTLPFYDKDFLITGIFKDMPENSHFHFDLLCSMTTFERYTIPKWESNPFKTYVLLRSDGSADRLQTKLNEIAITRMFGEGYAEWFAKGNSKTLPLQKLTDIHLNSQLWDEFEANGNRLYVRFFTVIAIFILIIAVTNYINLSTAQSAGRAREVGIRKTVGSTRTQIIRQFLFESILTSFLSLMISLVSAQLMLQAFRRLVGKSWLVIPFSEPRLFIPASLLTVVIIGVLSGLYPSVFLSAFKPISALSGPSSKGVKSSGLRNSLVVFQSTLSIFLLVGSLVVHKQMDYVRKQDLGFEREQVVVLQTLGAVSQNMPLFRETLLQNTSVIAVSASSTVPGKETDYTGFHVVGSSDSWPGTNLIAADSGFLDVMKMKMAHGRFFSKEILSDKQALVINEKKAREIGLEDIYDINIFVGGFGEKSFHVIGIIEDFHYESLHKPIKALGLVMLPDSPEWAESYISIRIRPENIRETIGHIRKTWEKIIPGVPFSFSFLDTIYNDQYYNEERTGRVFSIFTLFAILVSSIGLLGLTAFAAEQRTREIGIRKVLGASVHRITLMLSGELVRSVALANFIAWPAAYFVMTQWLRNFTFRTEIGLKPFLISAIIMLSISCFTVGYHAARAAAANPVNALKNE